MIKNFKFQLAGKKNNEFSRQLIKMLLIMKYFLIILFLSTNAVYATLTYAQKTVLSLDIEERAVSEVLDEIERQSEFRFYYNSRLVDTQRKVTVHAQQASVFDVLNQLFIASNVGYKVVDKDVILVERDAKSNAPVLQGISITGTVVDTNGEPLPGVNVVIKGTTQGVMTDIDGGFSITVPDMEAVLTFTYIGMKRQEITVGNQRNLTITLQDDVMVLDDVIVIGYGTAKRQEYTGSVGSVKLENSALALVPNLNALESLKGTVTGVNIGAVNSAGGQPGMLIRGQNSINGSNDPLIILDGVIFMGSLSDINPNDIANFDILKDAVSSAVYGSRSANGVIAITTKKGRSAKPVITLNTSTGVQSWPNRPVVLKGDEFLKFCNERMGRPEGTTSQMLAGELANYQAGIERVWLDDVTRTGIIQDYQLAVSGAGKGLNYYLSTSYNNNHGVVKGDEFERISLFGKINADITNWFNIGLDASYSRRNYPGIGANLAEAQQMSPYGVMYRDDEGNLERYPMAQSHINPMWGVEDGTIDKMDLRHNIRLNTYAVVSLPWVKGLNYRISFMPNVDQTRQGNFYYENYYIPEGLGIERYSPSYVQGLLSRANGNILNSQTYSYVFDNILTYKNTFGKHGVEGTLVATRDYTKYVRENMTGSDFSDNGNTTLGMWALHKATIQRVDQNNGYERANIGYLGRANYSYDGKYYLSGSIRRDGASVFGDERKWGTFAAVGVAWRITEEDFMKGIEPLNNLKLKFSWGQNGNQGISPYTTLSQVVNGSTGGYRYEFSNTGENVFYGIGQATLGNADLGWEKTNMWNVGFESAWLNNRLFVDLDMYYSQTTDQIFQRNIPVMTGFRSIFTSLGQVDNKGVELNIRSVNIEKQDWMWTTNYTFWLNRNKLVKLYGEFDENGKEKDDIGSSLFIGKSLGAIYGFKQIGIVQEEDAEYIAATGQSPGSPKFADLDGVPGISAEDRTICGYSKENFRMNMENTVRYKGFELYVLLTAILGGNNWYMATNAPAYTLLGTRAGDNNISHPYWTPENRNNTYPAINWGNDGRYMGLQSRGFVKVQNITFSYTFNQSWIKSANINSFKLFLAAKNVACFTPWVGGDPETAARYGSNTYPVVATYSVGLNFSF